MVAIPVVYDDHALERFLQQQGDQVGATVVGLCGEIVDPVNQPGADVGCGRFASGRIPAGIS